MFQPMDFIGFAKKENIRENVSRPNIVLDLGTTEYFIALMCSSFL
jgi:hypothetical protein